MKDSIERGWSERTVTVDRNRLLATLKENRELHQAQYRDALAGYKQQAVRKVERVVNLASCSLAEAKSNALAKIERFDPEDPIADSVTLLQAVHFSLPVPQDHTRAYDVAIRMAEWEVAATIKLTQAQFQCFVLDDWEWKRDFTNISKAYIAR